MGFIRSIGRWGLTALIINCIIGSGIFGVPGELIATVGRASPLAMLLAGSLMAVVLLCFAEVGSQFSEPGGVYLYARAAFGSFAGLQVGWFWFLAALGGAAASANLFVTYFSAFAPWAAHGWPRLAVLAGSFLVPAAANYSGVRRGAGLSTLFTIAKILPLAALIVLGLVKFSHRPELVRISEIAAPGWLAWGNALLLLSFAYSGFEDAMLPTGEVKNPRTAIPFSLIAALAICIVVYTLLQLVIVTTIGTAQSERALAATAGRLIGRDGAVFVGLAAMISTYGWISASILNAPRLLFSMADKGELPASLGTLHKRFNTPHVPILVFAALAWLLAATGTFRWSLLLSAGATIIFDGVICAALLRLRRIQPQAASFRLPFGGAFSALGIVICAVLLTQLHWREAVFMWVTAALAAGNWWWARRRSSLGARPQPASPVRAELPVP